MDEQYDNEGRNVMKKKIFLTITLIIFLAAVYYQGNAKDVSLQSIDKQLAKEKTISSMEKLNDRQLLQFMNLDSGKFKQFIYYKGTESLSVEELLIVKANNREDLSIVKDAVDKRIEDQLKTFESYGPNQVALLKDAVISTKGNYLFYCTGKNAEDYKEVLFDAI